MNFLIADHNGFEALAWWVSWPILFGALYGFVRLFVDAALLIRRATSGSKGPISFGTIDAPVPLEHLAARARAAAAEPSAPEGGEPGEPFASWWGQNRR